MARNMRGCGVPNATERIADMVLELVNAFKN